MANKKFMHNRIRMCQVTRVGRCKYFERAKVELESKLPRLSKREIVVQSGKKRESKCRNQCRSLRIVSQPHICLCLFVIGFKFLGLFSLKALSLMITLPLEFLAPAKPPSAGLLIMLLCNFMYKHWIKSLLIGVFFTSTL